MSEYSQLVTSEQADESLQLSRLRREIEQLKEQLKEQVAPPESPEPSAEAAVANLGLTAVAMQSDESAQVQEHDVALTPSPATTAESVRRGSDTGEEGRRRRPTSSLRHMRAVVRTVSVVKTKGLVQARLEAHEKALETLFESYSKYWELVCLSEALCATMAVVIVSATEDDVGPDGPTERQRVLAAAYGLSFGLAFIISTAGFSICVMLMVQFGFAVQKGAFILRYSVWMELPSTLLIFSGILLMVGVCARVFALYEAWIAYVMVSVATATFSGLLLLRRHMKAFVEAQVDEALDRAR